MKHQLNPGVSYLYQDAPHTGARLETLVARLLLPMVLMPPTRGHDLKHKSIDKCLQRLMMPPTRGHDLKL